ncbi:MAG TPA: hypothetical protein VK050_10365 [Flavobacteriaceae bacterium]|nr:hypothetical protein [Flavobacteriaceae bacterium]
MWIIDYLKSVGLIFSLEIITVITGLYFLFTRKVSKTIKLYIYLISATLLVEILALYTAVAYFSDYKYFSIVEGTRFAANFWMYNIFEIVTIVFLLYYFGRLLTSKGYKKLLLGFGSVFVLSSIIVFIINDDAFFSQVSAFVTITGAFLLLISIGFYLVELLQGKIILKGQNRFPLFVAVGVGISYLASLPFLIYSNNYHSSGDQDFIDLYIRGLQIINIIVYLILINGFFICLSKKNS